MNSCVYLQNTVMLVSKNIGKLLLYFCLLKKVFFLPCIIIFYLVTDMISNVAM